MMAEMLAANAVNLQFTTVNDIQEFVNLVKDFKGDVDMVQGRIVVDAKSILGICSMNMQNDMALHMQSGDFDQLKEKIQKFIR